MIKKVSNFGEMDGVISIPYNYVLTRLSNRKHWRYVLFKPRVDPDLNRNATKYRDNHIHKYAAGIILHFMNGKY